MIDKENISEKLIYDIKIDDKECKAINISFYDFPLDYYIEDEKRYLRLIDELENNIEIWLSCNLELEETDIEYDEIIKKEHTLYFVDVNISSITFEKYVKEEEFN